jgi:anaerobic ribonucleoside-triphosphate reductase
MKLDELKSWLDEHEGWEYEADENGLSVRNTNLGTLTHCTFEAIAKNPLETLTSACTQGCDVDHITRVTGYFSKTSGWNKGKAAELRDRHRSEV